MDSFSEPRRPPQAIHLDEVRKAVAEREEELKAKGVPLSGRVLHVCHYLPVQPILHSSSKPGIPSPPQTPPVPANDIPPSPSSPDGPATPSTSSLPQPKWTLEGRHGHAAMISGINSLSTTHEQLIIGWPGDVLRPHGNASKYRPLVSAMPLALTNIRHV